MTKNIMVIDDEEEIAINISNILKNEGYKAAVFTSSVHAKSVLDALPDVDLILTDIRMPEISGLELLNYAMGLERPIPVIIFTGNSDIDTAVEVMKAGASDFLCKPISGKELLVRVNKVLEKQELAYEVTTLRKKLAVEQAFHTIVGKSKKMTEVFHLIDSIASTDVHVLITGETGTGKELVAKAIHSASDRKDAPFVAVSCTAIQENLLESELFGHEKGAFTGAHATKAGKMEIAGNGTFLLDEVGDASLEIQAKLLRVLEEKEFEHVGGLKPIKLKARILASTNKNLQDAVKSGSFREDLYYRLNVVNIEIPPLRERDDDIVLIANHFLSLFKKQHNVQCDGFTPSAIKQLLEYAWPGNIRELRNVIERTLLTSSRRWVSSLSGLSPTMPVHNRQTHIHEGQSYAEAKNNALELLEKAYLIYFMEREGGSIKRVADKMDVSIRTVSRSLKKFKIDKAVFKKENIAEKV